MMRSLPRIALLLAAALGAAAMGAVAQTPGLPAAAPDTLTAVLSGPEGTPAPRWSLARPDTLRFGDPLTLTLEFPADGTPPPDSLRVSVPWLHVTPLPEATEPGTMALELRCWRAGPWRLAWGGPEGAGDVLRTQGRLTEAAAPEPVRDPWRPSRDLRLLAGLALLLGLLLAVAWFLWRGRAAGLRARASDPAAPAWALFTAELEPALASGEPRSGGTTAYLDRLGRAVRLYLARRYGVAAGGLTGGDVAPAVAERQYEATRAAAFDAVLAACDRLRFAPEPPSPAVCRELTADAVAAVATDRGDASAADAASAAAWVRLVEACRSWRGEEAAHA